MSYYAPELSVCGSVIRTTSDCTEELRGWLTEVGADGHGMEAAAAPPHSIGVPAAQPGVRRHMPSLPS